MAIKATSTAPVLCIHPSNPCQISALTPPFIIEVNTKEIKRPPWLLIARELFIVAINKGHDAAVAVAVVAALHVSV